MCRRCPGDGTRDRHRRDQSRRCPVRGGAQSSIRPRCRLVRPRRHGQPTPDSSFRSRRGTAHRSVADRNAGRCRSGNRGVRLPRCFEAPRCRSGSAARVSACGDDSGRNRLQLERHPIVHARERRVFEHAHRVCVLIGQKVQAVDALRAAPVEDGVARHVDRPARARPARLRYRKTSNPSRGAHKGSHPGSCLFRRGSAFARASPLARCKAGVPSSAGAFGRDTRR